MNDNSKTTPFRIRRFLLLGLVASFAALLSWRAVDLHVVQHDFLKNQGDTRHLRVVKVAAHRGKITDRDGEPLAISTPVVSVWANPQELIAERGSIAKLAGILKMRVDRINRLIARHGEREFVYIKRHINPDVAEKIRQAELPGIYSQREYRRYYPGGEVASHLVGFTNIDDVGQEGIELAYDEQLSGTAGSKRVIRAGRGQLVENVESISRMQPGKDMVLSIDRRLQYLAYRELKAAVKRNKARSGSIVLLDVKTGEVLAMVNQPSFNPNRSKRGGKARYRNRTVTDVFEPGSTIKPFTIVAALESGQYKSNTRINTTPGRLKVGGNTVRDMHNYGMLDVSRVLTKSSNVGASKIALSLEADQMWSVFQRVGIGQTTASSFPGEASGVLPGYGRWRQFQQATLSFGYGMSVTTLQLASAYAVLAADGVKYPVSLLKLDQAPQGEQVIKPEVARSVRAMLETVLGPDGTGRKARVEGYSVAGKTGTVHKSTAGGYADDRYVSLFAGMAPAKNPRLVVVVMIDEPGGKDYYGGLVAAPVFARIMSGALRLLDVPPDQLPVLETRRNGEAQHG